MTLTVEMDILFKCLQMYTKTSKEQSMDEVIKAKKFNLMSSICRVEYKFTGLLTI